jgi:hypothetical protein
MLRVHAADDVLGGFNSVFTGGCRRRIALKLSQALDLFRNEAIEVRLGVEVTLRPLERVQLSLAHESQQHTLGRFGAVSNI